MPARAPAATNPPRWRWQAAGEGRVRLELEGDWRVAAVRAASVPAPAAAGVGAIELDAARLAAADAGLAAALWPLLAPFAKQGAALDTGALPQGPAAELRGAFEAAAPAPGAAPASAAAPAPAPAAVAAGWRWPTRSARPPSDPSAAAFFAATARALGRFVLRRQPLRGTGFLRVVDHAGPRSLPIVGLTVGLVGLMLAYMGGAQLDRIGAPGFIADVVTVGVVRELAGLMTGVILAGRLGAAFAAQIAAMQASDEIDALRVLGVDPVAHLVLPRLVAMVLIAPPLIALAMAIGTLAGLPAAVGVYGVGPREYLQGAVQALSWTHLWIGLAKGTLYCALVALAGCLEGLRAGRNAQAVGEATTRAVVKALVWIVVAASATTALLQSMGF
jgi:phospholipid/cholesterol/gamma-HCH transport system permease protein